MKTIISYLSRIALALIACLSLTACPDDDVIINNNNDNHNTADGGKKTETIAVNGVLFTMIRVDGGTFTMGATPEQGTPPSGSQPTHPVTLSTFSIGQTEVTQALWLAVMGNNPSLFCSKNGFLENLQRPVEQVKWEECQEFLTRLNELTGRTFSLPTEAQWEYAARGGNKSQGYKYAGGNDIEQVGWYLSNTDYNVYLYTPGTQPVATKQPNEIGLYDMSGNVQEYCQDYYGDYTAAAQTNPTGPNGGLFRVERGGAWGGGAGFCRVSYRGKAVMNYRTSNTGFRLVLQD